MKTQVIDLDILKPEKRIIKLGGKEIDISFIPLAITFDVDQIMREMNAMQIEMYSKTDELSDDEVQLIIKKIADKTVKLCSLFCSWKYPEMDENWFMNNANAQQLHFFTAEIKVLLDEAYKGAEEYGKNALPARGRKKKVMA